MRCRGIHAVSRGAHGLVEIVDGVCASLGISGVKRKGERLAQDPLHRHTLLHLVERSYRLTTDQTAGVADTGLRGPHHHAQDVVAKGSTVLSPEQWESACTSVNRREREADKVSASPTKILSQGVFGSRLRESRELVQQGAVGSTERAQIPGGTRDP